MRSKIEISDEGMGKKKVVLNGQDISNILRAVNVRIHASEAATVTLELTANVEVQMNILGRKYTFFKNGEEIAVIEAEQPTIAAPDGDIDYGTPRELR